MAKIEKFEDMEVWQLARDLVKKIYTLTAGGRFLKDFRFCDQIRAAAISVMSNVAEGFERYSDKEFIQFLNIAKGSVGEVRSQLYAALDLAYIDQEQFVHARSDCELISKKIWVFVKYLRSDRK